MKVQSIEEMQTTLEFLCLFRGHTYTPVRTSWVNSKKANTYKSNISPFW